MDDREINAIRALLTEAKERSIGITFLPDDNGWEICHSWLSGTFPAHEEFEFGSGRLSYAYDLETAAAAALRPLSEVADAYDRVIRKL